MVDTDDTRCTTDERRTTPRVWHKLPTGELKILLLSLKIKFICDLFCHVCVFRSNKHGTCDKCYIITTMT